MIASAISVTAAIRPAGERARAAPASPIALAARCQDCVTLTGSEAPSLGWTANFVNL
jgi:hypothetical protein